MFGQIFGPKHCLTLPNLRLPISSGDKRYPAFPSPPLGLPETTETHFPRKLLLTQYLVRREKRNLTARHQHAPLKKGFCGFWTLFSPKVFS